MNVPLSIRGFLTGVQDGKQTQTELMSERLELSHFLKGNYDAGQDAQ